MTFGKVNLAIGLGSALLLSAAVNAAEPKLSTQDYIDIQQLSSKYSFAIDSCTNKGYDYSDLYTEDGEFGVSEKWGEAGRIFAKGRCKLLALGVGGNPTTIEQQGGYEDTYVKTKNGWRFKQRIHVFPNMSTSVQFGKKKEG